MSDAQGVVVFTGHREVVPGHEDVIRAAVRLMCETASEFVVGGAIGADTIALDECCKVGLAGRRTPTVTVIVANVISSQPSAAINVIGNAVVNINANIIEMKNGYNALSLKNRNIAMIDRALIGRQLGMSDSYLLAYWNGIYRSGTWSAINYANKNGLPVKYIVEVDAKTA